jgi:predicted acyl esterase
VTRDRELEHAFEARLVESSTLAFRVAYGVLRQQQDAEDVAFWAERNLLPRTKGKRTPVFLTQGFLESNTKPDAAFEFFTSMAGPKRAWFGQFDHVRGWQKTEDGRFETGRKVFVNELVRFLDRHLKGTRVAADPTVAVQDNLGRYRGETRWPPSDATRLWSDLRPGTYRDDLATLTIDGTPLADRGVWSFSQRTPHDVWLAGEPGLSVTVSTTLPNANLVAHLYDVSGSTATLVSRGAMLLRGTGAQRATFKLYGQDWIVRKGHRIAVLVSGADNSWWEHIPTGQSVSVDTARIGLTFLTKQRRVFLDGTATPRLDEHLNAAVEDVSPESVRSSTTTFRLPGPLR